ncbi:hypothetical protein [Celeribacter sp.]|uniref:hypothetical protein n=1 Tax=Celeribacter sp. TaxID=1890673 RepID=UPI003A924822
MADFVTITPSGISVAPIQNWSRNQAIDALEALCDALQSALSTDYQYYIAKKRETRIARHVDALEAWARVKSGVSVFSAAADKHPALLFIATQIATLLVYRLYGRTDGDVQINHIWDMAQSVPETNEDSARVAEIVKTVVGYALYMRDNRLKMPDVSDLLIE